MRAWKAWQKVRQRINFDGFFADLICDGTLPVTWHCIVQRQGASQVLFWSQEVSRQEAVLSAEGALRDLKLNAESGGQRRATIAEKKFMTLHETMLRLRSHR